jgi:hypothetical protein
VLPDAERAARRVLWLPATAARRPSGEGRRAAAAVRPGGEGRRQRGAIAPRSLRRRAARRARAAAPRIPVTFRWAAPQRGRRIGRARARAGIADLRREMRGQRGPQLRAVRARCNFRVAHHRVPRKAAPTSSAAARARPARRPDVRCDALRAGEIASRGWPARYRLPHPHPLAAMCTHVLYSITTGASPYTGRGGCGNGVT